METISYWHNKNAMNEIEMKKRLETLLKDFNYVPEYQVDVMGKKVDVPVKYSDASAFMIFFPISLGKAKDFLRSDRLAPVSILGGRCVLAVTFFNYYDCAIGPFQEFTFSIPVMVDSKFNIPILPIIFDSVFSNFGYNVILIGTNSDISRKHIEKIFPYPSFDKNISTNLNEKDKHLSANIKNGTDEVISVSLDLQGNYKMSKKRYNTYYTRDNKIYRVRLNTFLFWEKIIEMKNLRLNFGNHEISRIFEKLDVNPKPIASVYYKKAIEIASAREEI